MAKRTLSNTNTDRPTQQKTKTGAHQTKAQENGQVLIQPQQQAEIEAHGKLAALMVDFSDEVRIWLAWMYDGSEAGGLDPRAPECKKVKARAENLIRPMYQSAADALEDSSPAAPPSFLFSQSEYAKLEGIADGLDSVARIMDIAYDSDFKGNDVHCLLEGRVRELRTLLSDLNGGTR